MNKDIQSESDLRQIHIDKVGVKNVKYPIMVSDKQGNVQHTVADIDLYVDLTHSLRATHMSRFVEVLHSVSGEVLLDHIQPLLQQLKDSLHSERAYINIRFPFFIDKAAPVSKKSSLLDYHCVFEGVLGEDYTYIKSVTVPITTLCPCSKEISNFSAHNQRAYVTLRVKATEYIWFEELIESVEQSASCQVYPLLKRPDEKYVTEYAYEHPTFVEDIVRDIAVRLKTDSRILWFYVESDNIESIHNHNAFASLEYLKL